MRLRSKIIGTTVVVAAVVGGGIGIANARSGEHEQPITGPALEQAKTAAIAHAGGGRVTGTEVGDEESYYEVEVTRDDGSQVDVQLDQSFRVVGQKIDHETESKQDETR